MASKFYRFETGVTSTGYKKRVLSSSQGTQELWSLWICICNRGDSVEDVDCPINIVDVNAVDEADALRISLDYLKRVVRSMRKRRLLIVHLFPPSGRTTDQLFRLKWRLTNRRLLRFNNPLKCFVRGYGPGVLKLIQQL